MYQIHEVCERCHLSRKAIRLYEEKGLLHPDRIQGNRMYNKEDVVRLQCISYYRGLGFSLEQIQQLLHGSSEKCLKELLMTHKKLFCAILVIVLVFAWLEKGGIL